MLCADECLTGLTEQQKTFIFKRIRLTLGAPVVGVELVDEQLEMSICIGIEQYSTYVNDWFLRNRLGEMLGLPTEIDFTLKYVSNSLYLEKSWATSIGEQAGLGANGLREQKTDFITLTGGTQDYYIPANREVIDILWYTPSFINLFGLDPFANNNISYSEFGASFAGHTLYHVMPVFDTMLTAMAAEMRNRVRGSEYSYSIHGGPNGTKLLRLYPIPRNVNDGLAASNAGIGGGAGTPGTMFYRYYDRAGYYGNPQFSGTSANPGWTASTSTQQGNGLVSSPADAQLNYINYAQLNSVAQTWVKDFALAHASLILGMSIRGKFDGDLPIPDAELKLNADKLIAYSEKEKDRLFTKLKDDLEELSYDKILEKRAAAQESINKSLGFGPMGISVF